MDSSAHRRLEAVSRHLLQPCETETNPLLHQVMLKAEQLKEQEKEVEAVIIGGMVLDIHATPSVPANPRTSTPGKVNYVLGGVARNIAECMSKLGAKPFLISALGLDMAGNLLLEHWKSAGLSTEGIRKQQDINTAVVCNIIDANGELMAGVASVQAIETFLTPEWILPFKHNISSAPVMMIDANLSPHALGASCRMAAESDIPVWFEPVSVMKSRRIASVAKYITVTSPNEDELVAMANALLGENTFQPIDKDNYSTESLFQMLKPAISVLLEKGIEVVVVTLGPAGVFLCSKGGPSFMRIGVERTKQDGFSRKLYNIVMSSCPSSWYSNAAQPKESSQFFAMHFPALHASVVRLTGAGDCLVGGTLASICAGLDIMQSVAVGIAAAKAAVETLTNVPSEFNLTAVADDARTVYAGARVLFHQSML